MMTTEDQILLLRQVRLLYEWKQHLVISVEALKKLEYEKGQGPKLEEFEQTLSRETAKTQADSLRLIDEMIRKLEVV